MTHSVPILLFMPLPWLEQVRHSPHLVPPPTQTYRNRFLSCPICVHCAPVDLRDKSPDSDGKQPPLRILSLDGGGVRGVSSLYILKDLMDQVARKRTYASPDQPPNTPRPCDLFDLICGTSTGGLIAIVLGRLESVVLILLE